MVRAVVAGVSRLSDGSLVFFYHLSGDMARLLIPVPQTGKRSDDLWEHTCFEAFLAVAGDSAYREFNFSPSGQWATYAFSAYRRPQQSGLSPKSPQISTCLSAGRFELSAQVSADALPRSATTAPLQIGLSAVIESTDTVDGSRSYWALSHPAARPDFHQRAAFILELPAAQHSA